MQLKYFKNTNSQIIVNVLLYLLGKHCITIKETKGGRDVIKMSVQGMPNLSLPSLEDQLSTMQARTYCENSEPRGETEALPWTKKGQKKSPIFTTLPLS